MKFSGYYRDGAIVQRNAPVTVRGYAAASAAVKCVLSGGNIRAEKRTETDGKGRFEVVFDAVSDVESAFVLSAEAGGEKISARIRFGDVYLTLGQSNVSYSLSSTEDCGEWVRRAAEAEISVLDLPEPPYFSTEEVTRPALPLEDFCREYSWTSGKEEKIAGISALTVQTAALVSERKKMPVGAVHASMGGLSIEAYLKHETAESDKELVGFLEKVGRYNPVETYNTAGLRNFTQLSGVWNEKIAPLKGISFAGIVWYLGESSAFDFEFARFYLRELKMLLGQLRAWFGNIPFAAVHIAPEYYPYGDRYGYLYICEALTRLQETEENVFTVPVYDIDPRWLKTDGELYYHPIHPVNKAPVAKRIADIFGGGRRRYPRISKVEYLEGKAVCTVSDAGASGVSDGLKKGEILGFTLAGKDGKYYPARAAAVASDRIEAVSPDVKEPCMLTYAFMQYQDFCNGRATDGAPLLPFRSVYESVTKGYCFPPAYTTDGALRVYENCFGWQAGTCRLVPVWRSGEIYGAENAEIGAEITAEGKAVVCTAEPTAESFFLFGISPALCLSGHKHHLADYKYLNFRLKSDKEAQFLGVVARSADGEVFRFDLMNGEAKEYDSLPLGYEFEDFSVCLETGIRGDLAALEFSEEQRKNFVQAEFLFRAKGPVKVWLRAVTLSDLNRSRRRETAAERVEARGDTQLPEAGS